MNNRLFKWKNFFTRWFFIGLGLILISVTLSLVSDLLVANNLFSPVLAIEIICGVISSVGIALLIGCIFDFSKNSESFMDFISNILTDIIVSKKFLSSLTTTEKRNALEMILKPTNEQIIQYSNINEYFRKKINDSIQMFDTKFKTDLTLNIEARMNKKKGYVYCETLLTYTVYKSENGFKPIRISYEKDGSKTKEFKIITDKGAQRIEPQDNKKKEEIFGGIRQQTYTYNIPDEFSDCDKITVYRRMYEPGWGHWMNYCWESMTPYEGLKCHLQCFDNLTIKDFMIYDNRAYYHTEISEDRTSLDISSTQWLEPDTGFYITISDTPPDKTGQRGGKPTTAHDKRKSSTK